MSKPKKYTLQIEARLVVSREVVADSMEAAAKIAQADAEITEMVKPAKGWAKEYEVEGDVVAVIK